MEGRAEGRITQLVVEERAEHSEQVERVQVLLCSNIRLRRQKDALQGREMELSHDLLMLTEDISKITQRILNHKTVSRPITGDMTQTHALPRSCRGSYDPQLQPSSDCSSNTSSLNQLLPQFAQKQRSPSSLFRRRSSW